MHVIYTVYQVARRRAVWEDGRGSKGRGYTLEHFGTKLCHLRATERHYFTFHKPHEYYKLYRVSFSLKVLHFSVSFPVFLAQEATELVTVCRQI